MKSHPLLSIVLIIRKPTESIDEVYAALEGHASNEHIEIIIVDGRPGQTAELPPYKRATVLAAPDLNMPHLKALGAAQSRAKSIAFLEPKGIPESNWLSTVTQELKDHPEAALTGPVHYCGSGTAFDRAAYLFEYGSFSKDDTHAEEVAELAGNNMVLPTSSLLTLCGGYMKKNGLNKPFVQQLLIGGSVPMRYAPGMAVKLHTDHTVIYFFKSRIHFARCFGGMRCAQTSTFSAWVYRIGTPFIPLLVIYKAFKRSTKNPLLDVRSGLWLAGISFAWSWGEAIGYWAGTGNSCERLY